MRFIIIGAGHLCRHFLKEVKGWGDEIIVIDEKEETCREFSKNYGVKTVQGDATQLEVLEKAGIRGADVVIISTESDGVNISVCRASKIQFGIPKVITIVNNPRNVEMFRESGADVIICPTSMIISEMLSAIKRPEVEVLYADPLKQLKLSKFVVNQTSPHIGRRLEELDIGEGCRLVCLGRGGSKIFPYWDFVIEALDNLYFLGESKSVNKTIMKLMEAK